MEQDHISISVLPMWDQKIPMNHHNNHVNHHVLLPSYLGTNNPLHYAPQKKKISNEQELLMNEIYIRTKKTDICESIKELLELGDFDMLKKMEEGRLIRDWKNLIELTVSKNNFTGGISKDILNWVFDNATTEEISKVALIYLSKIDNKTANGLHDIGFPHDRKTCIAIFLVLH